MKAVSREKHPLAEENWRRVVAFWRWTGRLTDSEDAILRRLGEHGPKSVLERARNGDEKGSGKFQRGKIEAMVGKMLGVWYQDGRQASVLEDYSWYGPPPLVAYLRSLSAPQLFDLADGWVDYLTRDVDHMPPPFGGETTSAPGTVDKVAASESRPPRPVFAPPSAGPSWPSVREDGAPSPTKAHEAPISIGPRDEKTTRSERPKFGGPFVIAGVFVIGAGLFAVMDGARPKGEGRVPANAGSAPQKVNATPAAAEDDPVAEQVPAREGAEPRVAAEPGSPSSTIAGVLAPAQVSIVSARAGVRRAVQSGSQLQTGDQLWFQLEVEEPLFVYLVQVAEDGKSSVIYPGERELQLHPGRRHRVPTGQDSFALDDEVGVERIMLLTTTAPLARDHRELLPLLTALHQEGRWPSDWPLPVAQSARLATRSSKSDGALAAQTNLETRGLVLTPATDSKRRTTAPVLVTAEFISLDHVR